MAYTLRPYQQGAVDAAVKFLKKEEGNGIEILPTGSGKSLIIANIALALDAPILIFQPSKEILEQNFSKLASYGLVPCSIYSASCGHKDMSKITFATIGSVINHLDAFRAFRYIIIDECHTVNAKGGMYEQMIKTLGVRVLGLTATPYRLSNSRMGSMLKFLTRTRPRIFTKVVYAVQVSELLQQGFLANMNYYSLKMIDEGNLQLNSTGADYTDESVMAEYKRSNFEDSLLNIIRRLLAKNRKVLVFTRFIPEAEALTKSLPNCAIVTGATNKAEREDILSRFKAGKIDVVANVGVLTTGFDYPALDTVVMAKPTRSLSLWYQICGRAIRPYEGKISWIVDLCGTYNTFGKVEDLELRVAGKEQWAVFNKAMNRQLTNTIF